MALTTRARNGSVHSKCVSSRLSNRGIRLLRGARRRGRPLRLPAREIALDDLLRHWRCGRPAVLPGMLGEDGDGYSRVINRCERDEPGVVLLRPLVAVPLVARADRLGRARLARDLEAVDVRLLAGAPVGLDDVLHRVPHPIECVVMDRDGAQYLGLGFLLDGAVGGLDPADVLRTIARPTVGDHGGELRHLYRGGGDVPLADRAGEAFAGEPRLLEPSLLPGGARDRARILVVEPDAGGEAESEVVRPFRHQVDPETLAHLVEVDVARLDDRL